MSDTGKMGELAVLYELEDLLKQRKTEMAEGSYTASIYKKGPIRVLDKLGEELAELMVAVACDTEARLIEEAADSCFHFLLFSVYHDLPLDSLDLQSDAAGTPDIFGTVGGRLGQLLGVLAQKETLAEEQFRQELTAAASKLLAGILILPATRKVAFKSVEDELRSRMRHKK